MATERLTISTGVPMAGEAPRAAEWASDEAAARTGQAIAAAAYATAKRAVDILVAVALLLLLAPVLAFIAGAILVEGGGPIFYRGERVGQDGRRFRVVKFRSMLAGCDEVAHRAFVQSLLRDSVSYAMYKVPDDTRVTRLGRSLRRTSLDELPQLWNVLRGEMSLVGPRPDVPYAVAEYSEDMHRRLLVKPGITGLWQVSGRSRLSLLDMYRLDLAYVDAASFWLDLRILLRTFPVVLGRVGAA